MTTFDRLEWHRDAAIDRGQPPERGFTHMGLYLAWLIRHDLHDPAVIPTALREAVAWGGMTGSDARSAVDDGLSSAAMSADGAAFTEWYYPRFLDDYGVAFADSPDYGVADDAEAYARIAPTIDRRFAEWLTVEPGIQPASLTFSGDELRAMTESDLDAAAADLVAALTSTEPEMEGQADLAVSHDAPDLELLLPAAVGQTPLAVQSSRASQWGSSLLRQAIDHVGGDAAESFVAIGLGGVGDDTLAVTLYAIPGVPQDRLEAEFLRDVYLSDGGRWERREIGGMVVWWSASEEFDTALYALGGLVVTVGGSPERVRAALEVLP